MTFRTLLPGLAISPLAHAVLDDSYQMQWCNRAWQELCARNPMSGESWFDQIEAESLRAELPFIAQLQTGARSHYSCISSLRRADENVHVRLEVTRIDDESILACAVPVSVVETSRLPSADNRTQVDDYALAAAISHDFRQHVRLVSAYLSFVERQGAGLQLHDKLRNHVQTAAHHAMRLQGLITDLVRWLRLPSEPLTVGVCAVADLWNHAQQQEAEVILRTQAEVTADDFLPTVMGDEKFLCEVLLQILHNALHYHGPGTPRIHLCAKQEDAHWLLTVTDDGPGLTLTDCQRVGGLFQRMHPWEEVPGNGMGLALAKRMLALHHGTLEISSQHPEKGCRVQVRLPTRSCTMQECIKS